MYTQNKHRKTYTREFKLLIVNKYLNEGKTSPQLSVEYKLEISIIKDWIRKFRLYGASGLEDGRGKHNNHSSHGRPRKERFNSEVEALRHENMRLKGELYFYIWFVYYICLQIFWCIPERILQIFISQT